MRINKFKNEIEQLKKQIIGQTVTVKLENGETINLKENDLLSLLVEAMNYQAVIDNNGEVITDHREDIQLSNKAEKIRKAVPGQSKYIDTVREMLGGDDPDGGSEENEKGG